MKSSLKEDFCVSENQIGADQDESLLKPGKEAVDNFAEQDTDENNLSNVMLEAKFEKRFHVINGLPL